MQLPVHGVGSTIVVICTNLFYSFSAAQIYKIRSYANNDSFVQLKLITIYCQLSYTIADRNPCETFIVACVFVVCETNSRGLRSIAFFTATTR
jgi:hypothetical protein